MNNSKHPFRGKNLAKTYNWRMSSSRAGDPIWAAFSKCLPVICLSHWEERWPEIQRDGINIQPIRHYYAGYCLISVWDVRSFYVSTSPDRELNESFLFEARWTGEALGIMKFCDGCLFEEREKRRNGGHIYEKTTWGWCIFAFFLVFNR